MKPSRWWSRCEAVWTDPETGLERRPRGAVARDILAAGLESTTDDPLTEARRQSLLVRDRESEVDALRTDDFNPAHTSVTICPITSDCVDAPLFRVPVPSTPRTGLTVPSQVMVDKIVSVPREAIGQTVGRCQSVELDAIGDALRRWLAI